MERKVLISNAKITMTKTVEFFFDVGSPTAYLASTQITKIASETGATLAYRPMLLGGVFKATGNQSPVSVPAKGKWMFSDMAMWANRYGVGLKMNPHFPINTLPLMRGAIGIQMKHPEKLQAYLAAVMTAIWQDKKNMGETAVIAEVLATAGFDPSEFVALIAQDDVKAKLISNTEEAVSRGVFGAPTFFVGEQMFFGQDRLVFVKEALLGQ
jgi:2-hydroxychromene-2-carboxylate isomerase